MNEQISSKRIFVVDALRGFAIVSILLLHNLEHFDYYYLPENLPDWMKVFDKHIWDTLFFLFSGKSYAIFALLFGLTFYIQNHNQEKTGKDFRARFALRLIWLFLFGLINSAFYEGDILTIYAILGFVLIPVARLSDKTVLLIAVFLMMQPVEWCNAIWGMFHPDVKLSDPLSWKYFGQQNLYIEGKSLIDTIVGNLTNGKKAVYLWTWEVGRVCQTCSLFMLGMLAGRKILFKSSESNHLFWTKTFIASIVCAIPLWFVKEDISAWIPSVSIHKPLGTIFTTWYNVAFMALLVSGFVLLYNMKIGQKMLNIFTPFGKMSMTNYIMQSILGSIIYFGFGFGFYKYTGATYSLLIGISLMIAQWIFCHWWLKNHQRGPLECIWHKLTWIGTDKK